MKKNLLIFVLALFSVPLTAFAENAEVGVEFNALPVEFDQPAVIFENRTLVPLRKIFELLGAEVSWNEETRTAVSQRYSRTVTVTVGNTIMLVDGEAKELDVPAKIINNRMLVPLRAVSEAYGCEVYWNDKERCAEISDRDFVEAKKQPYTNENGLNFEYFADMSITENEGVVSLKSGACVITLSTGTGNDIVVDDKYVSEVTKGLKRFGSMQVKYVKKISDKNAVTLACYNKGNTIYYLFSSKNGNTYDIALTVPDGAQRYDAERLMYVMKSFLNGF